MDNKNRKVLAAQKNEITEHLIYKKLSEMIKEKKNKELLEKISDDELKHYRYWKSITGQDTEPDRLKVIFFTAVSYVFGLSFGLKLMENGEKLAQDAYSGFEYPSSKNIMMDEQKHEREILGMLEEEKLEYASSIVLGLNDALVELTGALAGFTFALQNGKLIGIIGLITGVAASMSMAASGYLSSKEEENDKAPIKSAIYTGVAYIITVFLLVLPFFLISNVFLSLALTMCTALLIIFSYTFYIAVAKGYTFWRRFIEMGMISLTVAGISFGLGFLIKAYFGVDI
ncbi:MAG: rubrerythrin family protein [Nanoarchaeota archaeon]|nr:rubrerythrin family protein [Nanoarchaeota archaeon]